MAKKIKLEITEAQLSALINIVDECSAMIGCYGGKADIDRIKWVRLIDRMLNNNGFKRNYK